MAKAATSKEESNIEEAETYAKELKIKQSDSETPQTSNNEPNLVSPIPDESDLGEDDLQFANQRITHPKNSSGPNLIEDDADEPPNFRQTRRSRREALLAAVEISGNCPTARQTAQRKYPITFLCDFAGSVLDADTGELLEYRHLIKHPKLKDEWKYSFGNEIGRLAQGMPGRSTGTNTMFFINKHEVPHKKWPDVANARIVCNVRPQKEETNRTRLTYAGQNLTVDMDCSTPTADLLTGKLLPNSVVSTQGAK